MFAQELCINGPLCTGFRRILLLMFVVVCGAVQAQVYRHVDDQGVVTYSDRSATIEKSKAVAVDTTNPRSGKTKLRAQPRAVRQREAKLAVQYYLEKKQALLEVDKEMWSTCGQRPNRSFAGPGPIHDYHVNWEKCHATFKNLRATAKKELKGAKSAVYKSGAKLPTN